MNIILKIMVKVIFIGLSLWLIAGCTSNNNSSTSTGGPTGPPVTADYGDAPDDTPTGYPGNFAQTGDFPTLYASDGARTLTTSEAILGTTASMEEDADDTADPDGVPNLTNMDSDDGIFDFFLNLTSVPPPGELYVNVSAPASSSGGTYYLNVVIDLDMDGNWGGNADGGEPEWVVQNEPVAVVPGDTVLSEPPAFGYSNGLVLPNGAWMRLALTKERIDSSDWDGSGEFSAGEIEDHVITIPPMKILSINCGGPFKMPPNKIPITCTVTNHGLLSGPFNWTATKLTLSPRVNLFPLGGPKGGYWIGTVVNPPNKQTFGLTATNSFTGDMPCKWKIKLTKDPDAIITPEGVTLGLTESSTEIEFYDEVNDSPTIAVDGKTESIEFVHNYDEGTSPCLEQITKFWVTNTGGGTLEWEVDALPGVTSWLQISPTSGTAPTEVTLTFDCTKIYGTGGFITFGLNGMDTSTDQPATNAPVVAVTWE